MSETMQAGETGQTTAIAVRQPREIRVVEAPVGIMDTARFEHLGRVAQVLAKARLLPMSLTHYDTGKRDGAKAIMAEFEMETLIARAFLVASQAELWNADPIAIAQCTSLVHGKLTYEGKLIHALISARAGYDLKYTFGRYDVNKGDIIDGEVKIDDQSLGVRAWVKREDGTMDPDLWIAGSVAMWHTGDKGPWQKALNWRRQLRYRGAREWARAHKPNIILGILSDDEVEDYREFQHERAVALIEQRTTKRQLRGKLQAPADGGEGFSAAHIEAETAPRVEEIPENEVEVIKPVGGEQGAAAEAEAESEEVDAGEAGESEGNAPDAPSADESSGTAASATPASTSSPDPKGSGPAAQSQPSSAGSAAKSTAPSAAKPPAPSQAKTPEPAAADDPIEAFIESLAHLKGWADDIKPVVNGFRRGEDWAKATFQQKVDVAVAVVETVFERDGDFKPSSDVSFFAMWCTFMIEKGARPEGGSAIAIQWEAVRKIPDYAKLNDQQKANLEAVANNAIGTCGTPS